MNPAEKIKAILDGFTEPLSKDNPFGAGGRKAIIQGDCTESRNLSFQAFVNRINTFKADYWGSDPNAAIYLAKYGFKTLASCNVQCCSCRVEVDMKIFLGKADALQTIAQKSHKPHCRWLGVSTPKDYFEIPRNPHRTLEELKITFKEMLTFEARLPLIRKEAWMKMGISEDFVTTVLDCFQYQYSDLLASCVVMSLCGWVKSSDTSLQCNFCQRVVGIWNFFCGVESPKSSSSKQSKIVSLLYSKIRRDMVSLDDSDVVMKDAKGDASSPSQAWDVPSDSDSEYLYSEQSGSDGIYEGKMPFCIKMKQKALRYLWEKPKRARARSLFKFLRNIDRVAAINSAGHRLLSFAVTSESDIAMSHVSKGSVLSSNNDGDHYENGQSIINAERKRNNGSNDKNGVSGGELDISDEISVPSVEYSAPLENEKGNLNESVRGVTSSNNACGDLDADAHSESSDVEELCGKCLCEIPKKSKSSSECKSEGELDKSANREENRICHCEIRESQVQPSQSQKYCDNSGCIGDDTLDNTDGKRKRKRVPENEQNGTPHDSDDNLHQEMQPGHYTKSKRKDCELSNESIKSLQSSGHDIGSKIVDGHPVKAESDSDTEVKITHSQAKSGDTPEEEVENACQNNKAEEYSEGPIIVSSKSVADEEMLQDYVQEEGRKFENGYRANFPVYSDISNDDQAKESPVCRSENVASLQDIAESSEKSHENESESSVFDVVHTSRCKRKREETEEDNNYVLKKPNLEDFKLELSPSFFHPELEHRFWCIWKIKVADHLGECSGQKKGWEYYAEAIKKGLEKKNEERIPLSQLENNSLHYLAEIVRAAGKRQ